MPSAPSISTEASPAAPTANRPPSQPARIPPLCQVVIDRVLRMHPDYIRYRKNAPFATNLADFIFATSSQPHSPDDVFPILRWGGHFLYAAHGRQEVHNLAAMYAESGFRIEAGPAALRTGLPLPFFTRKVHYFLARKILLLPPGADTERFTYAVSLVPSADPQQPLIVLKEVPTTESVVARLRRRFPEVSTEILEKRARKFTEKIFPTFLTREAGILKVLQEHLPEPYNRRVPRAIDIEKDERGYVRKLWMNWLRNRAVPMTQLEFAHQSADLLRAMHDIAHIIHLDLRLDNFVITDDGVGFVDFGSSVKDDEDLAENPLLHSLFEELMRTSQIQRMLEEMTVSGAVTSRVISQGRGKVDKAVDFFYLALQFNSPHQNPDLAGLIEYDPESESARQLRTLTDQILKPADPANPVYRSAKDILHGIERLQLGLSRPH